MKYNQFLAQIKPWILPMAMASGVLLHNVIGRLEFLTPYLIFVMLYVTFCRVRFSEMRPSPLIWRLLLVQLVGSAAVFVAIRPLSLDVAQGVMICVLCPTATAAPVVTGMLGGNVVRLVAYSLASNIMAALLAPFMLAWAGTANIDFLQASMAIISRVAPLILLPLAIAIISRRVASRLTDVVASHQSLSFYLWAVSLFIVVGKSVSFIMAEPPEKIPEIIVLAAGAGVACVAQFAIGRRIGAALGDKISGAQGLGQKNTVLAIWLALTYLNPISSVGPAAYIAWQNTINSIQLYVKQKRAPKR